MMRDDGGMTHDELRNATNEGLQAACGAAITAAADQQKQREQDRADRSAVVDNRRRIERETRDALRTDKHLQAAQGGFGI